VGWSKNRTFMFFVPHFVINKKNVLIFVCFGLECQSQEKTYLTKNIAI
jgi:hypothetical protein